MSPRISAAASLGILICGSLAAGCGKSSALPAGQATPAGGYSVVDASGAVLGPLLGSCPGEALSVTTANVGGVPVVSSVQIYPGPQYNAFFDASGHIWNVTGAGIVTQGEPTTYYATSDCTGPAHVRWGNPVLVMAQGGGFKVVSGSPTSFVPGSVVPPRTPPGACNPYTGAAMNLLYPVSALVPVTPPTVVPPVTIR
jgi:hypothetical protein